MAGCRRSIGVATPRLQLLRNNLNSRRAGKFFSQPAPPRQSVACPSPGVLGRLASDSHADRHDDCSVSLPVQLSHSPSSSRPPSNKENRTCDQQRQGGEALSISPSARRARAPQWAARGCVCGAGCVKVELEEWSFVGLGWVGMG